MDWQDVLDVALRIAAIVIGNMIWKLINETTALGRKKRPSAADTNLPD